MGLHCSIFRSNYRSDLNLLDKFDNVTLVEAKGPFDPSEKYPAVKLVRRMIGGKEYVHAEPADKPPGKWLMHGGSFISTSDSRFGECVGHSYPVPLHDRAE